MKLQQGRVHYAPRQTRQLTIIQDTAPKTPHELRSRRFAQWDHALELPSPGAPALEQKPPIALHGRGTPFSGAYRTPNVTHKAGDGGYRTSFQVRREVIP